MNQKKTTIIISIIVLSIVTIALFIAWQNKQPTIAEYVSTSTTTPVTILDETKQIIYGNTGEKSIYVSQKYGIQFAYPRVWRIGDNIDRGTFQLFNYPKSITHGDSFAADSKINKIEAVIIKKSSYDTSNPPDDYPEKLRVTTETRVARQKAFRVEIELTGGQKILSYEIPLLKTDNLFIITIYGNPVNFYLLDEIIATFEFINE